MNSYQYTTPNMIGTGTLLLPRNDALRQLLMAQPDLVAAAVGELLSDYAKWGRIVKDSGVKLE